MKALIMPSKTDLYFPVSHGHLREMHVSGDDALKIDLRLAGRQ